MFLKIVSYQMSKKLPGKNNKIDYLNIFFRTFFQTKQVKEEFFHTWSDALALAVNGLENSVMLR